MAAGGFDALIPAERQVSPRTDAEVLQPAARLKREHPARTAAHIARIIEQQHGGRRRRAPCNVTSPAWN